MLSDVKRNTKNINKEVVMDVRLENAHDVADVKLKKLYEYMEENGISIGVNGRRDGTLFVSIHEDEMFIDIEFEEEILEYSRLNNG